MDESEDDGLLADLAAIRPVQGDIFARSLRASVRRELLGAAEEPFRLGRFTVLEPIGSGGMGSVFVAYDPDLDRKIALKVLHNRGEQGRRDVLREGRALARLKHPNVVAVYEVGELDDRVFVAMEYVEGGNLREWLRTPRSSAAILDRLVEAGRGLAAAHAAGLVHRDLKPENLVIDTRGHARVIDFGLARPVEDLPAAVPGGPSASLASAHGGTPAYMAPERRAGAPCDRRGDQYSFCVTAWEALFDARPGSEPPAARARGVPSWLRRVLERGLESDPAGRWPSIDALLAAIERGRAGRRRWRAIAAVAGLAALGGAVEGARRLDVAQRVAACEAAGAELDAVWNDDAKGRLRAAFTATGLGYAAATVDKVTPWLDARAEAWRRARTDVCLAADVRREWDADTLDRAVWCLEDRRMEFDALVGEFERARVTTVQKSVNAAANLRPVEPCLDEDRLRRLPAPPGEDRERVREVRAEISQARAYGMAGDFKAAAAAVATAREHAESISGWPLQLAVARGWEGFYLEKLGAFPDAEKASTEAYFASADAGAWDVAADAATQLIYLLGKSMGRHADGRAWARHAAVAIVQAGDPGGLLEATRQANLAMVLAAAGDYADARALHERSLATREHALGPDHPIVAGSLSNLAVVLATTGANAEAKAMFERALQIREATLGPMHPDVALGLNNLAIMIEGTGDYAGARRLHERALNIRETVLGPDHIDVAESLTNLAAVGHSTGAYAEAMGHLERVLAIREKTQGAEHAAYAETLSNMATLHQLTGALAEARQLHERALAIKEKTLGPDHPSVAATLNNLGHVHHLSGADAEARPLVERAVVIKEKALGPDHPSVAVSLSLLARVYLGTRAYAEARPLVDRALAIREKAFGPEHPEVANSINDLADLLLIADRPREALPLLERAVAIVDAHEGVQPAEFDLHFALARALVAGGGDRERALAEARKARDGYRAVDGDARREQVAAVEKWLAERGE